MKPTFKQLTQYYIAVGAADIAHTEKSYLAHAIGVYKDLAAWGCDEVLCHAGLFHSIYGTQQFQGFTLPVSKRSELQSMIGDSAEQLAYANCFMDRASFDGLLSEQLPTYRIRHRESGDDIVLSRKAFDNLVTVHLCDWLEQVERSQMWDYRRDAYRQMAERLGSQTVTYYDRVFDRETANPVV